MTIKEAEFKFGTLKTTVSVNETLSLLVRRLYQKDDPIYYKVLTTLNIRYDWHNLAPGSEIFYLDNGAINQISEI